MDKILFSEKMGLDFDESLMLALNNKRIHLLFKKGTQLNKKFPAGLIGDYISTDKINSVVTLQIKLSVWSFRRYQLEDHDDFEYVGLLESEGFCLDDVSMIGEICREYQLN